MFHKDTNKRAKTKSTLSFLSEREYLNDACRKDTNKRVKCQVYLSILLRRREMSIGCD